MSRTDPAAVSSQTPSPTRVALLLGTLVALTVIGSSAVAVAIPVLATDLALSVSESAWVLAAFSLTFSIATAVFGRVADLVGLRLPLRVGGVLFAGGSLIAAVAPGFGVLIAGRLIQGAGAGAVPVLVVGIIAARFDEASRTRAFGTISAVVAVVSGSGPLIGGSIAQLASWRYVLALPVVAILLTEPVARLAPAPTRQPGRFDVYGALLVAAAVSGGALLLQSPATGTGAGAALGFGLLLVGGLALLVRHVRAHPEGFLPRAVVTTGPLMAGSLAGMTLLAAYIAMLFAVPTLLSEDPGWTPLQVGLAMLPAAAFGAVISRVVGAIALPGRRRAIVAVLAGGSALGLSLAALVSDQPVVLIAGLGLAAAAFGGGQVAILAALPGLVAEEHRGVAIGVFNLLFFVGGTIGAASVGGLSSVLPLGPSLGVVAVLPALGVVAALRLREPRA